jgi:hypothetical protein
MEGYPIPTNGGLRAEGPAVHGINDVAFAVSSNAWPEYPDNAPEDLNGRELALPGLEPLKI